MVLIKPQDNMKRNVFFFSASSDWNPGERTCRKTNRHLLITSSMLYIVFDAEYFYFVLMLWTHTQLTDNRLKDTRRHFKKKQLKGEEKLTKSDHADVSALIHFCFHIDTTFMCECLRAVGYRCETPVGTAAFKCIPVVSLRTLKVFCLKSLAAFSIDSVIFRPHARTTRCRFRYVFKFAFDAIL